MSVILGLMACTLLSTVTGNALENSGFEKPNGMDAPGWVSDDIEGSRWLPAQAPVRSGNWSMKLQCAGTDRDDPVRLVSKPVAVRVGDAVKFGAWTCANGTPRENLRVFLEGRRGSAWQRLEPVIDRPQSDRWLKSEWMPHEYTAFVPGAVEAVRLVIEGTIMSEIRVSWFVDDCTLEVTSLAGYLDEQRNAARLPDLYLAAPDTAAQNPFGCYGDPSVPTPTIDRLAAEGRLYTEVTSACPWTKPSFASILTSLYPSKHTVEDIYYALPEEVETLAEVLKAKGYFTAAFVWTSYDGFLGPYMQFDQGFDIYFYSDDELLVKQAILHFLETNAPKLREEGGGGLFIWHHIWEPHLPYTNRRPALLSNPLGQLGPVNISGLVFRRLVNAEPGYANPADAEYMHDVYKWEINYTDHVVGEVLDRMKWAGRLDTLNVLFCSDHGDSFNEKPGIWGHTHGYETCVRTPFILRFPGRITPGERDTESLVSNLDIMPTLLDLAGADPPAGCEGRSLLETEGKGGTAQFGISETRRHGFLTIRDERYKLVVHGASTPIRDDGSDHTWNLYQDDSPAVYELYDLQEDPFEGKDLALECPEELTRLKADLDAHCVRTGIAGGSAALRAAQKGMSEETLLELNALGYLDDDGQKIHEKVRAQEIRGQDGGLGFLGQI